MYSQQIVAWGEPLEGRQSETPEPKGSEVLIKVDACGICHSDIHIWEGSFDLGGGKKISLEQRGVHLPFTMGHEVVGEVVAVGPDVDADVTIGDKRIVYPWIGCGECNVCQRGDELLCMNPITVGTRRAGGYSDYTLVPHSRYLIDYTGVAAELACTYACSGITAYSALKKAAPYIGENDHLVIIGAGGVGLSAVHFASSVIAGKVIVADVDAEKRSVARQAGAWQTIDNSEADAVARMMEITGGGAAATIDFVGRPETAGFGVDILRKGGTQVAVGLYGGAYPLSVALLPLKMINILGSYVGSLEEMHELMDLVKAGKIAPIPIETRALDRANESLGDLKAGKVVGRIVLKP